MKVGGLFEGYGGLTTAARSLLGGELAWVSEYEPPSKATPNPKQAAARLLAHRHPDVPNLGDITAIDWPSVEPVDVLCAGFPCQDVSSAGKRAGMKPGNRSGLWEHTARAIAVLRPSLVLLENVRGLLSAEAACDLEPCPWCMGDGPERPLRALGAVLGDLAALGFNAEWTSVLASDVGAPHGRWRVFVVAWPAAHADASGWVEHGWPISVGAQLGPAQRTGHAVADPERLRLGARRTSGPAEEAGREPRGDSPGRGLDTAADSPCDRRGEGRAEPARLERRTRCFRAR